MARIPDEDITRVREATDAVAIIGEYVQLRQRGVEFWGCCPFHGEKTPSFKVNPQTQLWHCFGCGEGGNIFKFLMMKEQFEFPEAVRYLAGRAGIQIHEEEGGMPSGYRARLLAVCEATADFYHLQLMRGKASGCDDARRYLGSRGLGGDVPKKWNLGYAPGSGTLVAYLRSKGFTTKEMVDANVALSSNGGGVRDRFYNRVMFPINDLQGRTIAFGGRVIGKGEPKYINTSNCPLFSKRSNMYGIDSAKSSIVTSAAAIVVEGYTDVIAMHGAGFENTVATLGTALTQQHVKLLSRFANRVIYLFDGDAAGQNAADKASELITENVTPEYSNSQMRLDVAVIPDGMDPAECIAAGGREAMQKVLDGSKPLLRFAIDRRLDAFDLTDPVSRSTAASKALELLLPLRGSILADQYLTYVSDRLKLDPEMVRKMFVGMRAPAQTGSGSRGSDSRASGGGSSGQSGTGTGARPQGQTRLKPQDKPTGASAGRGADGSSPGAASTSGASGSSAKASPGVEYSGTYEGFVEYDDYYDPEPYDTYADYPDWDSPADSGRKKITVPRDGLGRQEAELLCAYASMPSARSLIVAGMEGRQWSQDAYARCMQTMLSMGTDASEADLVQACMRDVPECEMVWQLDLGRKTPAEAEDYVKRTLRKRDEEAIKDAIADLQNRFNYGDVSEEEEKELYAHIGFLQNQLKQLRM